MAEKVRELRISQWLERIERSRLSPHEYLAKHSVPFSLAQYYRYRAGYWRRGSQGLVDGRSAGNNRCVHAEAEGFLMGYFSAHPDVTRSGLLFRPALHPAIRFVLQA